MNTLIMLVALVLPLMVQAQPPQDRDWWACQSVEAGGLIWKTGQWSPSGFRHDMRFILISDGDNIAVESAAKAMDAAVSCSVSLTDNITCVGTSGTTLMFSKGTGNGAISELMGGVVSSKAERRDTLSVVAFECVKG